MTDIYLGQRRVAAARASGGASADPIYDAILKALAECPTAGAVLDFGAGKGSLAHRLCARDPFTHVVAADIMAFPDHRTHPKLEWVFGDLNRPLRMGDARFDLIVAAEVVEHLENPRFVAREWFRLLKPGGRVILSTPNNESWRSLLSLLFRGHFVAYVGSCYPAHITPLLRADLARVLREAGFDGVEFSFTDCGSLPKLTRMTWQRLSFGRLKGLRYSDNLLCIARKPSRVAEVIAASGGRQTCASAS